MRYPLIGSAIVIISLSLVFNVFCEEKNVLPERYFSEDYLYGICFLQGLNETVKAVDSLNMDARRAAYVRYLDMANEYEAKAELAKGKTEGGPGQISPEEQRRSLLIALNCFEIVAKSPVFELKGNGERGIKRCRNKLLALKPGEFEDQYLILQRCIDVDQNPDVKKKEEELRAYYERAKEYEDKAGKASDKEYKRKNVLAALDFYGIVVSFTKDGDLKKQANDARIRCVKMMANL